MHLSIFTCCCFLFPFFSKSKILKKALLFIFTDLLILEDFECEEIVDEEVRMRTTESLQSFLENKEKSDILLEQHLEALKASNQQQLDQIKLQHQVGLERRTLQNSLISTNSDAPLKVNRAQRNLHSDEDSGKSRGSIYP